jgi:chromosome segregation ATPase
LSIRVRVQAQLAKSERDIQLRDEEVTNLKQLVKKREEELEEMRQLQDSLKLKVERYRSSTSSALRTRLISSFFRQHF